MSKNNFSVVEKLVPASTESVNELLNWAKEENFETILIVGVKDDVLKWQRSSVMSMSQVIGLMEIAKIDMVKQDI